MAYSGFLSDEDYARKSLDETINGKWVFKDQVEFEKLIKGTTYASYYADLAEYYECESNELIPLGTLVSFGGNKEITKTSPNSRSYFGIVSTSPAFVLNEKESDHHLPVALTGRVPARTRGIIHKFDRLTTSKVPGVLKKKTLLDSLLLKPTVGVALEEKSSNTEKLIEIFMRAGV